MEFWLFFRWVSVLLEQSPCETFPPKLLEVIDKSTLLNPSGTVTFSERNSRGSSASPARSTITSWRSTGANWRPRRSEPRRRTSRFAAGEKLHRLPARTTPPSKTLRLNWTPQSWWTLLPQVRKRIVNDIMAKWNPSSEAWCCDNRYKKSLYSFYFTYLTLI